MDEKRPPVQLEYQTPPIGEDRTLRKRVIGAILGAVSGAAVLIAIYILHPGSSETLAMTGLVLFPAPVLLAILLNSFAVLVITGTIQSAAFGWVIGATMSQTHPRWWKIVLVLGLNVAAGMILVPKIF
jgi:hypothetical protein